MKKKYILIIAIIAGAFSCTEKIDIKPTELEKRLIVDATVTNELTTHFVQLSVTKLITADDVPTVSNANVEVMGGGQVIKYIETDTVPGLYYSEIEFKGIPDTTYHLKINNVDVDEDGEWEEYHAEATMPLELKIDSIALEYYYSWEAWAVKCYAWDPPVTNYYNFRVKRNGHVITDTLDEYSFTDDFLFNGNYTNGIDCYYLQDEYEDEYVTDGDSITLVIENIDKSYFEYLVSAQQEFWGYNPMFGGPPANVYSNASNSALGIFRVYTVNSASVIIDEALREE